MQISFILVEPAVHENVGFDVVTESFRLLNLKIEQFFSEVRFSTNSDINFHFFERINYPTEDYFKLLHSFCNKFLKKINNFMPDATFAKGFRH